MYKTESVLGLIGSILGVVAIALILIVSLLIGAIFNSAVNALTQAGFTVTDNAVNVAVGASVFVIILGLVFAIAAVVLGFIGSSKLKKDDKKGGIFLIIAGVLALVSLFTGGIFGIATMVLFFIGGIMAVAKKGTVAKA